MDDPHMKPPGGDFTCTSEMWYIDEVRVLLSESNMCILRNSCFGHLVEVGEMLFLGDLYNILCRRLHSSSFERMTLEFAICKHIVEFGPADFCLMSGLKYKGSLKLPKNSKFHCIAFPSRAEITFAEIHEEFRNECEKTGGNSMKSLKLAYLFLAYGLFGLKDPTSGNLDMGYCHLVDDVKKFNEYPWGRVAYENLVAWTHRAKKLISNVDSQNQNIELVANGFVYALQCWAFEVIPTLGTYCASLVPEQLMSFPRILRWTVRRQLVGDKDDVWKFFVADRGSDPVRMLLTTGEMQKLCSLGITSSMHVACPSPIIDISKHVGRKLVFDDGKAQVSLKKTLGKRKVSPMGSSSVQPSDRSSAKEKSCNLSCKSKSKVGESSNNETPGPGKSSRMCDVTPDSCNDLCAADGYDVMLMLFRLKGQIESLEEYVKQKLTTIEQLLKKSNCEEYSTGVVGLNDSEAKKDCVSPRSHGHLSDFKTQIDAPRKQGCTWAPMIDASHNEDKDECGNDVRPSEGIVSELALRRPKNSRYDRMLGLAIYDPTEKDFGMSELKGYIGWTSATVDSRRPKLLELPTDVLRFADATWFNVLWRHDGWLENTHIDTLINLLLMRYDKEPRIKTRRDWTCMEICCWEALTEANIGAVMPSVMSYVRGDRPIRGGLRWKDCSHIFGVGNINNCHWVFFEVSLHEQAITVYNSLEQPWECIVAHFANLRINFPKICTLAGLWEQSNCRTAPIKEVWDLVEYPNPPRQINQSDCGIMVIKYMECRAFNVPVDDIDPRKCATSRHRYCAKLYELSQKLSRGDKL